MTTGRNAKRFLAARSETGGDADEVLFRDADLDDLLGQCLAKRSEFT